VGNCCYEKESLFSETWIVPSALAAGSQAPEERSVVSVQIPLEKYTSCTTLMCRNVLRANWKIYQWNEPANYASTPPGA
jgi:hypothetical protein